MSASKAKLYYTPTSCGAASYIAQYKGGLNLDTEEVNISTHKTASGEDYYKLNPKGNVPALVLPGGVLLNEGSAVLQWIADQAPQSGLAPANGTVERYQLQNHLNYIASEVHASCGPLFNPKLAGDAKQAAMDKLYSKYKYLEEHVFHDGRKFINGGNNFTVADSYLYIVLSWHPYLGTSLDKYPKLKAYFEGISKLPFVQEAHKKMGEGKHAP